MFELLNRQILFVGGKGGVGKTTIAAALAVNAALEGKHCLLVSTDPAHSLGDIFGKKIGDRETQLFNGLQAIEIDPDASADRHIESVKKTMRDWVRPSLYKEIDRQMDLAHLAPGATESAMLERLTGIMLQAPDSYDLVVIDTAPTGHTLRLLSLPESLTAWTEGLLVRKERSEKIARTIENLGGLSNKNDNDELSYLSDPPPSEERNRRLRETLQQRCLKFTRAREILTDSKKSAFILVLIPEKLPILESQNALKLLGKHRITLDAVIINRLLPHNLNDAFMQSRKQQETKYIEKIEHNFSSVNRYYIPLLQHDVLGIDMLQKIGMYLS